MGPDAIAIALMWVVLWVALPRVRPLRRLAHRRTLRLARTAHPEVYQDWSALAPIPRRARTTLGWCGGCQEWMPHRRDEMRDDICVRCRRRVGDIGDELAILRLRPHAEWERAFGAYPEARVVAGPTGIRLAGIGEETKPPTPDPVGIRELAHQQEARRREEAIERRQRPVADEDEDDRRVAKLSAYDRWLAAEQEGLRRRTAAGGRR